MNGNPNKTSLIKYKMTKNQLLSPRPQIMKLKKAELVVQSEQVKSLKMLASLTPQMILKILVCLVAEVPQTRDRFQRLLHKIQRMLQLNHNLSAH